MLWGVHSRDLLGKGRAGLLFMVRKVPLRMKNVSQENQPTTEG